MTEPAGDQLAPSDEELLLHFRRTAALVGVDDSAVRAPRSLTVEVDAGRIHLLDWEVDAPPLLLIHGYGLNAHTWDAIALGLWPRYRSIALDQLGHGLSDWGSQWDYTLNARARAAELALDAIACDRFAVIGHSLGGLVSLALASRLPHRVAAVSIVDASPFASPSRVAVGARYRQRTFASLDEAVNLLSRANPGRDRDILRQNLQFNLRMLADGRFGWRYDPSDDMLTPEPHDERNQAIIQALAKVTAPVLVVRGSRSESVSMDAANALAEALPNGQRADIEPAGHNVQGDAPGALVQSLRDFFGHIGY